jgi:hypothetical protein
MGGGQPREIAYADQRHASCCREPSMRATVKICVFVMLASFVVACDGGGEGGLLGGDVVGSWRLLPNAADDDPPPAIADRHVLEFAADGTYIERERGDMSTGTYQLDAGTLVITEDDREGFFALPYRASGNRLVLGALVPEGGADGIVGTWVGSSRSDEERIDVTLELSADASARIAYDFQVQQDEVFEGSWRAVGNDVEIVVMPQENFTFRFHVTLVEGVLGTAYERI